MKCRLDKNIECISCKSCTEPIEKCEYTLIAIIGDEEHCKTNCGYSLKIKTKNKLYVDFCPCCSKLIEFKK